MNPQTPASTVLVARSRFDIFRKTKGCKSIEVVDNLTVKEP